MSTSLSNEYGAAKERIMYIKTCVKRPLSKRQKVGFQDQLSLKAGQKYCRILPLEHSAILSTFIKLPFVIKILVLSILEWPFYTSFTECPKRRDPLRSSGPTNTYQFGESIPKWALAWYGKLTRESSHAWILKILCYLIVWGITLIFMARLSFLCYSIANLWRHEWYHYNTLWYPVMIISKVIDISCNGRRNVLLNSFIIDKFAVT